MANQVTVSNDHSISVTIEPPANVQVQVSRAVIGTVANVASANLANYVIQNSQPNITSVGTLTGLTSSGNITAPFFIGNVVGNISGNFTVPGSNTAVLFNQLGNAGASDALKFNYASNVLTANGNIVANYFIGNGSQLTDVNAVTSNIANTANSVAVANVVGIGNIAVVNLDGNLSNILYGNGIFAAVPNVSNVANANFANFAGNVTNSAQPNITSVGTLTGLVVGGDITPNANITYSLGNNTNRFNDLYLAGNTIYLGAQELSANANGISFTGTIGGNANGLTDIPGANVTGYVANATHSNVADLANSVAVGNVSGIGNIATINLDGNVSNLLTGNGTFVAIPTGGSNANYANFAGTVITNAQPNITSVGTLTSLSVTGNVSANAYQLTTSPGTLTAATGQMVWSASEQTMNLGMNYGVTQQVGLENYILIKASATINDGQVIMFTGANGDNVTGAPANTASAGFRPEYIIGVATQDIANNDFGYVTVFGVVHGLNTNAYNVGDILWVDNATPGGLTATRPSDPNFQIEIAAVTKKSGGDGHIQVRVTTFNNIDSLTDVTITTPSNGQALVYSGNVWVNGNPNIANIANTVSDNAQPNITSVGTLTSLAVSGNITGAGNLKIGNILLTEFSSTLSPTNSLQVITDTANANNRSLSIDGGTVTSLANVDAGTTIAAGTLVMRGGTMGSDANRISSNTQSIQGGGITLNAGLAYGANNQTRSVTGGGISFTAGRGQSANANAISGGPFSAAAGGVRFQVSNVVSGGSLSLGAGAVTPDLGLSSFSANTVNIGGTGFNFGTFGITTSNGVVGTIRTPLVNFGAAQGQGTTISNGVSNITIGNIIAADQVYFRTPGIGGTAGITQGNINNVVIGNITTPALRFETGSWQYPGGSNVSNVSVTGNYTSGDILVLTGAVNNAASVLGTITRGNVRLNGRNIVLEASNTSNSSGTGLFVFDANNTANLGNLVIANNANFGNANVTGVSNLGNVGNVKITGGTANYVLATDGTGNLDWVAQSGGGGGSIISNGNSNVSIPVANGNVILSAVGNNIMLITGTGVNVAGSLDITGVSNLGSNSNVIITGGTAGYVLSTNGSGNLSWVAQSGGGGSSDVDFTPSFLLGGM